MKTARRIGLFSTVLYLALFFPSFYVFMLCPRLFENAEMTSGIGILLTLLSISVPVSIVFSIIFLWYMYFQGSPKGVYIFCATPIAFTIFVLLLMNSVRMAFL